MNRREFIGVGAASLALAGLGGYVRGSEEKKMRVGVIGTGWYGKIDLFRLIQVAPVEVVSLCDVDKKMLSDAADMTALRQASHQRPRLYQDYRKMLAEKDLDLVLIGTPDHWHALTMIAAVEAGADVYCQKPLSIDITEGRAMLAAARKHGKVVQIGTQRRSTPHLIEAKKFIDDGRLGKIAMVEIYCYYHMRASDHPPDSAPPDYLDYDMWTGPAPMRPFNALTHPRRWRAFMEYGNGIVGDMCVHMLDMVRWMMNLGWPTTVSSTGGIYVDKASRANTTDTQTATFAFPEVPVIWQHRSWGDVPPGFSFSTEKEPRPGVPAHPRYPWGATFYGNRGTLEASVMGYTFTPTTGDIAQGRPLFEYDKYPEDKTEKDLERHVASAVRVHMRNLLDCVATRAKPVADIEQGYISTTSCILANLSQKLGRSLTWDPATSQIVNDEQANKLLTRSYRSPWEHPKA